jgi:hypothetical protein
LSYVTYFDKLATPAFAVSPRANSTSIIAGQIVQLKNIASNQSSDIKEMKKFMSQEVQLLKSMGQEFDRTATQSSFAALGVFFLGLTLVIFGLKLTLKATDRRTSRYFKAMMLALIIPVIALLASYQIGIPIYKAGDSFFFTSLLLFIPVGMVIFLMIAEGKLITTSHEKGKQQREQP